MMIHGEVRTILNSLECMIHTKLHLYHNYYCIHFFISYFTEFFFLQRLQNLRMYFHACYISKEINHNAVHRFENMDQIWYVQIFHLFIIPRQFNLQNSTPSFCSLALVASYIQKVEKDCWFHATKIQIFNAASNILVNDFGDL